MWVTVDYRNPVTGQRVHTLGTDTTLCLGYFQRIAVMHNEDETLSPKKRKMYLKKSAKHKHAFQPKAYATELKNIQDRYRNVPTTELP